MNIIGKTRAAVHSAAGPILVARERHGKAPLHSEPHTNFEYSLHLRETAARLKRPQNQGIDRGVSRGTGFGDFSIWRNTIAIPIYRRRAVEIGEWESVIQMDSGAVMGGMYNTNPIPAVCNNGMCLLG